MRAAPEGFSSTTCSAPFDFLCCSYLCPPIHPPAPPYLSFSPSIGELFDQARHRNAQGTEIKAMTYSAMAVHTREGVWRAGEGDFAGSHGEVPSRGGGGSVAKKEEEEEEEEHDEDHGGDESSGPSSKRGARKGAVDLYFIVDI